MKTQTFKYWYHTSQMVASAPHPSPRGPPSRVEFNHRDKSISPVLLTAGHWRELSPTPSAVYKTTNILVSDFMIADIKQNKTKTNPLSMKTELEQERMFPQFLSPRVPPVLGVTGTNAEQRGRACRPRARAESSFPLG